MANPFFVIEAGGVYGTVDRTRLVSTGILNFDNDSVSTVKSRTTRAKTMRRGRQ
jgi:hypothetical protein